MHSIGKLSQFEQIINYNFKDKNLLMTALTHPSYHSKNEKVIDNYQRLEFLGDSVLSFIITDKLFKLYPYEQEGELARYRAALIRGSGLANFARKIKLPDYILLSEGEYRTGGSNKDSILEDVFEALIGGIYLDSDIVTIRSFIESIFYNIEVILNESLPNLNPKGTLQELIKRESPNYAIEYRLLESSGPDHNKFFTTSVVINGEILGKGSGSSKKTAEEGAAIEALEYLKSHSIFKNKD